MDKVASSDEETVAEQKEKHVKVKKGKRASAKKVDISKIERPLKKKRRSQYDPTEEARLERIVFGDASDIIERLPSTVTEKAVAKPNSVVITNAGDSDDGSEDDNKSDYNKNEDNGTDVKNKKKPAWIDEDDVKYTVDAALSAQNRKLPVNRPEKSYTEYLQNKYKHIVGTPKWADMNRVEDEDADDLDREILKHSCHLEVPKSKKLPKNIIDIKALTAINKQTHTEGHVVSSLRFHPSSTVALVTGTSGILSLFQVDGNENNKLHSMEFKKFPISKAEFLKEGNEILVGSGFYPFCHSYNLINGKTYNIPLPHGITNMKRYEVSPDGKLIALCGRSGEIYLLTSSSMELITTLKMNAKCRALAFTPDNRHLISHGDSSEIYVWDINSRKCLHRAMDDGCLSCESIAVSSSGQFMATGSQQGVVNLYDTSTVLQNRNPVPLKIILNLVTSITALKFNPTSEILAMASDKIKNAFKLVHIPSFTVFSNFPTFQTKIGMPKAIDFSPRSGYLGISNKSSSALLYRLKHYGNY